MPNANDQTIPYPTSGRAVIPIVNGVAVVPATTDDAVAITLSSVVSIVLRTPPVAYRKLDVIFIQDAAGGRTVTWSTAVSWVSGNPPIISSGPGARTRVQLLWDNGVWYEENQSSSVPVSGGGTGASDAAGARFNLSAAPRSALYLPGTSGVYASCPDAAPLDIVGDITIGWFGNLNSWANGATQTLVGKWNSGTNQRSYALNLSASGALQLLWTTDGTGATLAGQGSTVTVGSGRKGLLVTLDADTGAGQYSIRYWTSVDGFTWTELGTARTGTAAAIFSGTALLEVGSAANGTGQLAAGKTEYAWVASGIGDGGVPGGTVVALLDQTAPMGPRYLDAYGNPWTLNGSTWQYALAS